MELIGLLIGLLLLVFVIKFMGLAMSFLWNGLFGAIGLYLYNLLAGTLGLAPIKITIIPALIVGFFGIPGLIAVIIWNTMGK